MEHAKSAAAAFGAGAVATAEEDMLVLILDLMILDLRSCDLESRPL